MLWLNCAPAEDTAAGGTGCLYAGLHSWPGQWYLGSENSGRELDLCTASRLVGIRERQLRKRIDAKQSSESRLVGTDRLNWLKPGQRLQSQWNKSPQACIGIRLYRDLGGFICSVIPKIYSSIDALNGMTNSSFRNK